MKHKQIAFGVVGLLVGAVIGFFSGLAYMQHGAAPQTATAGAAVSDALPEGHPPVDALAQIQQMEQHALEHPEHTDVKIRLGDAYFDMGRFDAAIGWYEKALEQEPENVNILTVLATCYFSAGDAPKSIELARRALEIEKDNPVALQYLGWFYFSTEDYQAAVQTWERLVAAHPDFQNIAAVKAELEKAKAHLRGDHS